MSKEYPRITIVTPSFNQARYMERTILSVVGQNYPNLEYIIVDGGSTDGSVDIIRQYEKHLAHWVSEPDGGQADAINKGFRMATGDLVAWQNSDDIYLDGAFEAVAREYRKNPGCDVIFGNIHLIDSDGKTIREMRFHPFAVGHLIYYDWNLSSQSVFWKRGLFSQAGYLRNLKIGFDYDWFIRLGLQGCRFRFVHEFLGGYRIHGNSKLSLIRDRERVKREILGSYGITYITEASFRSRYRLRGAFYQGVKFAHFIRQGDFGYLWSILAKRMSGGSKGVPG